MDRTQDSTHDRTHHRTQDHAPDHTPGGAQDRAPRRALIVIDVQESFRAGPQWEAISDPRIGDKVNLVVWVLHSEPGTGGLFDPALGHVRPMAELERAEHEPLLLKTSHNAFTTTGLQQILTSHGVGELTVCGIRTEQCVETTARVGSDLGYRVLFVTDATATGPIPHRDAPAGLSLAEILADPRTLPAEEVVRRTEYALAGRFATITTVARLEAAAEPAA
jgi:nicotinamidase-related amidase